MKYPVLISLPLLIFCSQTFSYSKDFGPLLTRSQSPLHSTGLIPRLRDSFKEDKGEIYLSTTISSIWAETEEYTYDYYQNEILLGGTFSISPKSTLEVSLMQRFVSNNHLDSLTMDFHDFFGIDQNGRDQSKKHRTYIREHDNKYTNFNGDVINNSVEIYIDRDIFTSYLTSFSLGGSLYYSDVSSGVFCNRRFEQSLQLNASIRATYSSTIYAMSGLVHRNNESFINTKLSNWVYNFSIGMQHHFSTSNSLLIEYRLLEGAAKNKTNALSDETNELIMGYRYHFGKSALELSVTENIANMDNSADITFSTVLRHKF
ncbi:DUF3187 family protein [Vibrio fluvialis]|nr:DUF3187 family protein [Vibrio fluvialis]